MYTGALYWKEGSEFVLHFGEYEGIKVCKNEVPSWWPADKEIMAHVVGIGYTNEEARENWEYKMVNRNKDVLLFFRPAQAYPPPNWNRVGYLIEKYMTSPRHGPPPKEILQRFNVYHRNNLAWGSLHIVLEDGNVKDSDVNFCIDYAVSVNDHEGAELARILLMLSKTQRLKIGYGRYKL